MRCTSTARSGFSTAVLMCVQEFLFTHSQFGQSGKKGDNSALSNAGQYSSPTGFTPGALRGLCIFNCRVVLHQVREKITAA